MRCICLAYILCAFFYITVIKFFIHVQTNKC